jgi:hypothetical protein
MFRSLNHFNDGLRARAVLVLNFGPETIWATANQAPEHHNLHIRWTNLRQCLPIYIVPENGTDRLLSSKN